MSDFKPIIIKDIPLNDFLEIYINKCFYNKFHIIEKKLFSINYDIKKFFNELFSLSSTMVHNYKMKYELFEFLEKYFNELSEDSISEIYYKLLLISTLNDFREIFYNTNVYNDLVINIIEIEDLSNKYQSISSDMRFFLNKEFEKINQNEIKKYFIEVVCSMKIPENILRQIVLDDDESYNTIEVINSISREINIYGIESIINCLYVEENQGLEENQDSVKIIKLINDIINVKTEVSNVKNTINNQSKLIDETLNDYSDIKAKEKIIALKELGILDYLKKEFIICQTSTNKLSEVLSLLTGEKASTIQSYINPMINKGISQKNNPYSNPKLLEKTQNKLNIIGLNIPKKVY
ncbi:hypothetical protein OBK29_07360 [Empedobacter falsenii]|uniref:hypothetical protein n=1 Tax=Empedobacter falsenii TaxID=343874 RepID=UPI003A7FA26E